MKNGWQSVPNRREECGYDQGSTTQGDPHWFAHDLVEVKPGIGNPESPCLLEQEYQSAPSMKLPKSVKVDDQQVDKIERGIPRTGAMLRGLCGQLPQSKVRRVVMSAEMKSV